MQLILPDIFEVLEDLFLIFSPYNIFTPTYRNPNSKITSNYTVNLFSAIALQI